VQGAIVAALARSRDDDLAVGLLELHPPRHLLIQLAERAVHDHAARVK
jgi:hypothetical protein